MGEVKFPKTIMLNGNQLSRYGAISKVLPLMAPNAKVFFVGKTTLPSYIEFSDDFPIDATGGNRIFPTLAAAIADSNVVASRGDVVLVLPGHTETISGAAGITFSKAGITWIGLGTGALRPTITFGTAIGAQIIISGANQTFQNFIMDFSGFDAITAAVSITAADVTIQDCDHIISNGTAGVVLGYLTAATATRVKWLRCRFTGPATSSGTTTTACIKHEVGVDYVIQDCYFTGKMTQAVLNATAVLRGLIKANDFVIATGTVAITMHASSTPFIVNNRINVPSGTAPITAAAGFVAGNVYSAAAGVTAGTASTF